MKGSKGILVQYATAFAKSSLTILLTLTVRNIENHEDIDVVLYGAGTIYSKSEVILDSSDPVAASIAKVELLELLGVVEKPYHPSAQSDLTALANLTMNHTTPDCSEGPHSFSPGRVSVIMVLC